MCIRDRSRRPQEAIPVAPTRRLGGWPNVANVALGYGITLFACFLFVFVIFDFVRASTTMCTRHTRTRSRRPQEAIPVAPRRRLGGWQLWPWDTESHFLRFFYFVCASTTMCTRHTRARSRRPQEAIPLAPRRRLGGWQLWPWDKDSYCLCFFVFF